MTNGTGAFTGLGAGTYTVTITDANGCVLAISVTITPVSTVVLTTTVTNPSCFGGTGTITVTSTTGGNGAPYTYAIDGGAFGTATTFTGLAAGSHTVTVRDSKGCVATSTQTVIVPPVLMANISSTPVSCYGGSNGTLTVSASGGTPGYTFTLGAVTNTTGVFTGLSAGTYTVTVTDSKGCVKQVTGPVVHRRLR